MSSLASVVLLFPSERLDRDDHVMLGRRIATRPALSAPAAEMRSDVPLGQAEPALLIALRLVVEMAATAPTQLTRALALRQCTRLVAECSLYADTQVASTVSPFDDLGRFA